MPTEALTRTLTQASNYWRRHSGEPGVGATFGYFTRHPVAPLNRKRLAMMMDEIDARSRSLGRPLRVLDLACGAGLITSAIAALGHRTLGLDLSESEIKLARGFAAEEGTGGVYERADLLDEPAWEKRVEQILGDKPDVIVLAYALHHLPRVEEFCARIQKWLPPGAMLLINEENPEAPFFRLKHVVRTFIQKDTDVEWHRTYPGWKSLLEAHGFEVAAPRAADLFWGVASLAPLHSWSLVFTATRK